MLNNMDQILSLPDDTKIFSSQKNEQILENLAFCHYVEGKTNPKISYIFEQVD